jgi:superfamily I DNA and/or RNA helicase
VLAGTCLGFLSVPEVKDLKFDICIIDEASKATSTEALVPMTKSAKWIIVGDSKQLSAADYELSDSENTPVLEKYGLSLEDVSETLFNRLERDLPADFISSLDTQYRMCNPIGEMISDCFYEGKLSNEGPEIDLTLKQLFPPVSWHDTSGTSNFGFEHRSGSSFSNRDEMNLILESLNALKNYIELGLYKPKKLLDVLVISPYAAQIVQARTIINDLRQYPLMLNSIQLMPFKEEKRTLYFSPPCEITKTIIPDSLVGLIGEESMSLFLGLNYR